jgi:hypothetical protein
VRVPEPFSAADFDVPATFRNRNFAKNAAALAALALFFLWLNDASSWRLEGFGVALVVVPGGLAVFEGVSWWLARLRVEWDVVSVGGVFVRRRLRWQGIESFSIMEPADRTPFMLNFGCWRDQARVNLTDGSSHRVRAVQPFHGFTVVTFFAVSGETDADRVVDALNTFHLHRLKVHID